MLKKFSMKKFKIFVQSDISKIKSILVNSTDDMDLLNNYVPIRYNRTDKRVYVGKCDGTKIKLSVVRNKPYIYSPILKGEIHELDDKLKSINFNF